MPAAKDEGTAQLATDDIGVWLAEQRQRLDSASQR